MIWYCKSWLVSSGTPNARLVLPSRGWYYRLCTKKKKRKEEYLFPRAILVGASSLPTGRQRPRTIAARGSRALSLPCEETERLPARGERSRRLELVRVRNFVPYRHTELCLVRYDMGIPSEASTTSLPRRRRLLIASDEEKNEVFSLSEVTRRRGGNIIEASPHLRRSTKTSKAADIFGDFGEERGNDMEPLILLRIVEVLQSAYKAGHVPISEYIGFMVTQVARFKVFPGKLIHILAITSFHSDSDKHSRSLEERSRLQSDLDQMTARIHEFWRIWVVNGLEGV
ncbi:hypothetical protein GW17_00003122 [Ensete ventricosum]|nr:hypothetical protein GW17_00003122 [Ensete ventricosum]